MTISWSCYTADQGPGTGDTGTSINSVLVIFRIVDIDKQVAADISSVEIRNDGVSVSDHPLGSLKANFQLLCIGI